MNHVVERYLMPKIIQLELVDLWEILQQKIVSD